MVAIGNGIGVPFLKGGGGVVPLSLLLDLYPNAVKAHSFQKLRSTYAGDVQAARGATTDDVPFSGNFQDNTELLNIVGAGDGFQPLWYDQSTRLVDSTQTTASYQPKIVDSGSVEMVNGYPVSKFDETDDYLVADDLVPLLGGNNQPWTITAVVKWEQTTYNGGILVISRTELNNRNFMGVYISNTTTFGGTRAYVQKRSAAVTEPVAISNPLSTTELSLITADFDGADVRLYVNGVLQDTQNIASNWDNPINNVRIGARFASPVNTPSNWLGSPLAELVVWDFSQFTAGNIDGINDNIKSRYGIT